MSWNILRQIVRNGIRTEPAPSPAAGLQADLALLRRSAHYLAVSGLVTPWRGRP